MAARYAALAAKSPEEAQPALFCGEPSREAGQMQTREQAQDMEKAGGYGEKARVAGVPVGVMGVIWSAAAALAIATAYECGGSVFLLPELLYGTVLWGWWGVIATGLWYVGERRSFLSGVSVWAVLLHAGAGVVLGAAHLTALWSMGFLGDGWYAGLPKWAAFHVLVNMNRFGIEMLVYGFVFGLVGVIQYRMEAQREKMRSLELERQLSVAQLRALQMQMEPHFLFNTLNAITTLVELGRQEQAVEMLAHLNVILKSTLKRAAPMKVPLAQELEMVENYLAIEQVRFADRLRIEIAVEPAALDSLVPCFLLQPIVENAIRHGIARGVCEGLVEASARREGGMLRLEVRNSGVDEDTPERPGNGIGLKNTRERLVHFYRDQFEMRAQAVEDGGFEVTIAIPYERGISLERGVAE